MKKGIEMSLSTLDRKKLNIINKTLKEEHQCPVTLDESISKEKLNVLEKNIKNELREISLTENSHKKPEYSQCTLVLEAVSILKGKKQSNAVFSEASSNQFDDLDAMEEKVNRLKKSNPEKAKMLESKLDKIREKVYSELKESELKSLLKEDAEKAEVIMASKNLLDTVQGFQGKISDVLNKDLDPFIENVRNEYGSETADDIREKMSSSLEDLMNNVRTTKDTFYNCVNVLSGYEDDSDDISSTTNTDSIENDDASDMDIGDDMSDDETENTEDDTEFDMDDESSENDQEDEEENNSEDDDQDSNEGPTSSEFQRRSE